METVSPRGSPPSQLSFGRGSYRSGPHPMYNLLHQWGHLPDQHPSNRGSDWISHHPSLLTLQYLPHRASLRPRPRCLTVWFFPFQITHPMPCGRPLGIFYIVLLKKTLSNPTDELDSRTIVITNKLRTSSPLINFLQAIRRLFQYLLIGSRYIPTVLVRRQVIPNPPHQRGFHVLGKESYMTWGSYFTRWCDQCHAIMTARYENYPHHSPPPHHPFLP